jgi:hypothetical protein
MKVPPFRTLRVTEYESRDWSTKDGASELALRIMAAWRAAGHERVVAWPERITRVDPRVEKAHFAVRTNLVNGLPPGLAEPRAA